MFVQEVGYQHGRTVFDIWVRSGVLEKMLQDRQGTSKMKACDVSAGASAPLSLPASVDLRGAGLPAACSTLAQPLSCSGLWHSPRDQKTRAGVWPFGSYLLTSFLASLFLPHFGSLLLLVGEDGGLLRPLLIFHAPAPCAPGVWAPQEARTTEGCRE